MVKEKSFLYDFIKIIATILVVIGHSARMYTDVGAITPVNQSYFIGQLCRFIYSFHMPVFICTSGMVFGLCVDDLGKYTNKLSFIKNKVLRLLVPYAFFGILYVAPIMVSLKLTNQPIWDYILNGILLGTNSRHLWFLTALFFMFIIFIFVDNRICKINPIIILICLFVISYLSKYTTNIFSIRSFLYYLIFFYLGRIINLYYGYSNILKKPFVNGCCIGFLIGIWNTDFIILKIVCGIIGSLILLSIAKFVNPKIAENSIFKKLKQNSFGIYLFHPMIIYLIYYFLGNKNIAPGILFITAIIISFVLSYGLTELFRKIKFGIFIGDFKKFPITKKTS